MIEREHLEWPFFDDGHRKLAEDLDRWCAAELTGSPHDESDAAIDAECARLLRRLGDGGWLRYVVPSSHGGVFERIDIRSIALIRETLARYSGLADFVFAMQGLGSGSISLAGTEQQRRDFLPAVSQGRKVAAFALTELRSGSDVASLETSARLDGEHYVINGDKTFISNGGIADYYILFARTGEAPGSRGVSAFIVEADTPGLEIAERIAVTAPHPLATLRFNDMRVPTAKRLGESGQGFKLAMATLDIFRTSVGAAALGFARCALNESLDRVTSRRLFGETLADQPVIQAQLADMRVAIETSALLIYRSAWVADVGSRPNSAEAAMAKMYATEAAQKVIDTAVQMHGGLGVVRGGSPERLYREIRPLRIYEGATEVQQMIIGRHTLARHRR